MNLLSYFPYDEPDPRTSNWLLIRTPYPVLFIIFNYLYFVLRCGPNFMKGRQAYELKTFIKFYNIIQILANSIIVINAFKFGLFTDISLRCEPIDLSPEGKPMQMAVLFWWVLLLKLVDFIETGVFILRKKNNQVSFLHLYHHVSIVLFVWLMVKLLPGGMLAFHMAVNSFVHVIMYSYYLGSSIGPMMNKIVSPLKKYITIIQMVQFGILLAHISQGYFTNCNVPRWPVHLSFANISMNFILFYNFYKSSYKKSQKSTTKIKSDNIKLKFN